MTPVQMKSLIKDLEEEKQNLIHLVDIKHKESKSECDCAEKLTQERKRIVKNNWKVKDILEEKLNHLKMKYELEFENQLNINYMDEKRARMYETTLNQSEILDLFSKDKEQEERSESEEQLEKAIEDNYQTQKLQENILDHLH